MPDGRLRLRLGVVVKKNPDADVHAARAVAVLRHAFASGYANVSHMLKDSDLDSLRRRVDYVELVWGLADEPPVAARTAK